MDRPRASSCCATIFRQKLLDALGRPDHYKSVVAEVRKYLAANYSYERRMTELVGAFEH